MFNLTVKKNTRTKAKFIRVIKGQKEKLVKAITALGYETRDKMRTTINTSAKTSTSNLSSYIHLEAIGDSAIGIGNINALNSEMMSRYWYVLNYGTYFQGDSKKSSYLKYYPGRPRAHPTKARWIPGEWQGGRFNYIPGHKKGMLVRNPITPINYIESTYSWLKSYWKQYWKSLGKTIK